MDIDCKHLWCESQYVTKSKCKCGDWGFVCRFYFPWYITKEKVPTNRELIHWGQPHAHSTLFLGCLCVPWYHWKALNEEEGYCHSFWAVAQLKHLEIRGILMRIDTRVSTKFTKIKMQAPKSRRTLCNIQIVGLAYPLSPQSESLYLPFPTSIPMTKNTCLLKLQFASIQRLQILDKGSGQILRYMKMKHVTI